MGGKSYPVSPYVRGYRLTDTQYMYSAVGRSHSIWQGKGEGPGHATSEEACHGIPR